MNFENFPLLSVVTLLPLFGAIFISLINKSVGQANAKYVALWTSLVTLFLSLLLWIFFDIKNPSHQFIDRLTLLPYFSLEYKVGVDGLSLSCVLLTTLIFPLVILAGWESIKTNLKFYASLILALESFLLGTFTSLNLLFFFICLEGCLIPMYFLIGLWGAENRTRAALNFFLYTFLGSIFLLAGSLVFYSETNTFDLEHLSQTLLDPKMQTLIGSLFLVSFAIKMPIVPLHTWLPLAHVQAPAPVSMLLAGVLLKIAGYGFLRFFPTLFPEFLNRYSFYFGIWVLISIVYTSWLIFSQQDIKKIIACSSIAHMGLVFLGVITGTIESLNGALIYLISHGFIAAGLFFSVGILYGQVHSRNIEDFGGLARVMPVFSILFFLFSMGAIGVPGTSGFVGEFLILMGTFKHHILWAFGVGISMIFTAIYMMNLYKNVFFSRITGTIILGLKDLDIREKSILIIFAFFMVGIGLFPKSILRLGDHTFSKVLKQSPSC